MTDRLQTYTVTLTCDFEADTPEEAAAAFREFMTNERNIHVTVHNDITAEETEAYA